MAVIELVEALTVQQNAVGEAEAATKRAVKEADEAKAQEAKAEETEAAEAPAEESTEA
jgi:large subunit ribosomal protein L17